MRDLAVVERADLQFGPGLNVVTGETGAGKSVLLGAIGLLTGARADRSLVRSGAAQAEVSGVFRLPPDAAAAVDRVLAGADVPACEDGALLVRRTLSPSGSGRCSVNDAPVTAGLLRRIGAHLVDFHGPHDNQSLLDPLFQTDALDSFGGCAAARAAYSERRGELLAVEARRRELLSGDEESRAREIDMLSFQTREISDARLDPLVDGEMLQEEYAAASNAARILENGSAAVAALTEAEGNAADALSAAVRALREAVSLGSAEARAWLESASAQANAARELSSEISSALSKFEMPEERVRELEERMSLVESLKHKYGRTVSDVLAFRDKASERLAYLVGRDAALAEIDGEIAAASDRVREAGAALSALRRRAASALAVAAARELSDLGLARAGFEVAVRAAEGFTPTGTDAVEFGFAPNPGEPMRPLRDVASSGEISRVMLALKTVLAAHDRIPVLVFDEIDANVGGEIARTVGGKLAALGASRQVLCITHLPQVASCGLRHFAVKKEVRGGRTFTEIAPIEGEARVSEIARMLGGEKLTSVVRRHAEELLGMRV